MSEARVRYSRFVVECPLSLQDESGKLLDAEATVRDLTPSGMGFQTRAEVAQGQLLRFELSLPGASPVSGRAQVVWSHHDLRGSWAGAKFLGLAKRDEESIRRETGAAGYDWRGAFDRVLGAATLAVLVLVAEDVLRHRPELWRAGLSVAPTVLALGAIGVGALYFLRRR